MAQCKSKENFLDNKGRCQGESGHKGHHWFYKPNGSLFRWKNKNWKGGDKKFGCEIIPPSHYNYVHPKDAETYDKFRIKKQKKK